MLRFGGWRLWDAVATSDQRIAPGIATIWATYGLRSLSRGTDRLSIQHGSQRCSRRNSNCPAINNTNIPMIVGTPGISQMIGKSVTKPATSNKGPNDLRPTSFKIIPRETRLASCAAPWPDRVAAPDSWVPDPRSSSGRITMGEVLPTCLTDCK